MSLDAKEIARLRALCEAATSGGIASAVEWDDDTLIAEIAAMVRKGSGRFHVVAVPPVGNDPDWLYVALCGNGPTSEANAAFIGAARAALPAALDALEEARALLSGIARRLSGEAVTDDETRAGMEFIAAARRRRE